VEFTRVLEIGGESGSEVLGLSDIHHATVGVEESIYPGRDGNV
jgi:hypothetical protein